MLVQFNYGALHIVCIARYSLEFHGCQVGIQSLSHRHHQHLCQFMGLLPLPSVQGLLMLVVKTEETVHELWCAHVSPWSTVTTHAVSQLTGLFRGP